MWTMMIAVALWLNPRIPVTVTGVVVDAAGKPVSDVEVVLAAGMPATCPHAGTNDDRQPRGFPS